MKWIHPNKTSKPKLPPHSPSVNTENRFNELADNSDNENTTDLDTNENNHTDNTDITATTNCETTTQMTISKKSKTNVNSYKNTNSTTLDTLLTKTETQEKGNNESHQTTNKTKNYTTSKVITNDKSAKIIEILGARKQEKTIPTTSVTVDLSNDKKHSSTNQEKRKSVTFNLSKNTYKSPTFNTTPRDKHTPGQTKSVNDPPRTKTMKELLQQKRAARARENNKPLTIDEMRSKIESQRLQLNTFLDNYIEAYIKQHKPQSTSRLRRRKSQLKHIENLLNKNKDFYNEITQMNLDYLLNDSDTPNSSSSADDSE